MPEIFPLTPAEEGWETGLTLTGSLQCLPSGTSEHCRWVQETGEAPPSHCRDLSASNSRAHCSENSFPPCPTTLLSLTASRCLLESWLPTPGKGKVILPRV